MLSPFSGMINKYTARYNSTINRFCEPILKNFGVNHFWYYKVTNEGGYTCLGSHLPWMEYYYDQKLYQPNPFIRKPSSVETGTKFVRGTKEYSYQKSREMGIKDFKISQSLLFINHVENGIEGYGFGSQMPVHQFEASCIKELPLLELFVSKFKNEFRYVINKMDDQLVDIEPLIGIDYNKSNKKKEIDRELFLIPFKLSNILSLTHREKEVLFLVSQNLFAAQIGHHLQLSKRTVEHYIENIKNKLNCSSKLELIQKAKDFLTLGYPLP